MRRLTRGIGLFGGPGAMMSAKRIKGPPLKPEEPHAQELPAEPEKPDESPAAERKGWLQRLFGSDDDSRK